MHNATLGLVCLCPVVFAVFQYVKTYKAINALQELTKMFEQISCILNSCALELQPLFDALEMRLICPDFCKQVKQSLKNGDSFLSAWQKAVMSNTSRLLSVKEVTEIISFAQYFGYGSLEEQQKLCARYAQYCINNADERRKSIEKNGRLCLTGSVLFGIFLYIVLM